MKATDGEFSLKGWLRFGELHLEEADTTEILLYRRYSVEKSGLPSERIEAADQDVLKRFYSYERTPEFEEQLSEAFEYSRGLPPYRDYWFFNLDKIILGEWPLEKVPEHLRDIVKEARGE